MELQRAPCRIEARAHAFPWVRVVVKSNSLAALSGGDTKQRLAEWMARPGRPSSKLWYLSGRFIVQLSSRISNFGKSF